VDLAALRLQVTSNRADSLWRGAETLWYGECAAVAGCGREVPRIVGEKCAEDCGREVLNVPGSISKINYSPKSCKQHHIVTLSLCLSSKFIGGKVAFCKIKTQPNVAEVVLTGHQVRVGAGLWPLKAVPPHVAVGGTPLV
jgi:hypothetical protein